MTGVMVSDPVAAGRSEGAGRTRAATTGLIVVGVDRSEAAKGAVRVARELSEKLGAPLMFVHAVGSEVSAAGRQQIGDELDRLLLDGPGTGGAWLLGVRHPADCIVETAAEVGASMVVVGSSGPRSSLLGSVSAEVSRRAPCPVVVVPPGADRHDGRRGARDAREVGGGPGDAV
jgi:nucleotide-binding universal stress UspA family protein